jgi:predicted peroxiredoxin
VTRTLVVKLTHGVGDGAERVAQAFTVAASAVAMGAEVSVWLTGEAVELAVPGAAEAVELPESTPLSQLRDMILDGGQLIVCTQCAARRGLTQADLVDGAVIAGSATFVEQVLTDDSQALVY